MRLAGRVAAAIQILTEIFTKHRPASEALKDWGKAHRFAGSTDRHAIGTLVYDALRRKQTAATRMGDGRPRALALGVLREVWGLETAEIETLAAEQHGPGALTENEIAALNRVMRDDLPVHVAGDFPEWMTPHFTRVFGERAAIEGAALAQRAPIDLRVNTIKSNRTQVLAALYRHGAVEGPLSPLSVRIPAPGHDTRNVNVEVEPSHGLGQFEVQDSASQVAALLAGAMAHETVADICAGAGGKTLALAATMKNDGKLVAHDMDKHRLRPIFERMTRAGVTNIEVIAAQDGARLKDFKGFDCVLVDAPCTGSGAWRRKPDAKWRLAELQLKQRQKDQWEVMAQAAWLVKPGGRMIYITCSVLAEENTDQVKGFLERNPRFSVVPYKKQWAKTIGGEPPISADGHEDTLLLTPASHGTDGFFIAILQKD